MDNEKGIVMVYFIAEAGINHNGSIETAKDMIKVAKAAGADCVKFQLFNQDEVKEVWDVIKEYHIDINGMTILRDYCYENDINFLCSAFGLESLIQLSQITHEVKVPSGKIVDIGYMECVGELFKSVILSTGMANKKEIHSAIHAIGRREIAILHCVSAYPPPDKECNIKAIRTLREVFPLRTIGFSNHSGNYILDMMAVAAGAEIIEKHFTLDRRMKGPDHHMSLPPGNLTWTIKEIREAEQIMGNGILKCEECEKPLLFRRK